ncbi:hypothetical protein F3N42_07915 [Marinihelvus fidelis]|uniref:Uncharacterized protein n=1 Tax=Marinihelvus fidelis TaxID=2613842 RepID=A0A5N0TCD4_9GAMM|nr:hypothetical protein [Marinihelvus fidelis]KAA9132084.1 hypothetical protein F3N42_07915 [Marinihelvus fidelis]
MNHELLRKLSFVLIFAVQVPVLLVGIAWYPDVVARLLAYYQAGDLSGAALLAWNLSMAAVIVSPMVLLVGPYSVAAAFWQRLGQPAPGNPARA